jgi:hypothetical protein
MKRLFTIFTILTLFSCDNSKSHGNEVTQVSDTIASLEKVDHEINVRSSSFKLNDSFVILKMDKSLDRQSSLKDTTICNNWTLTNNEAHRIINDSEIISGPDWHHLFDHLPCSYSGQLGQNDITFEFEINAGSWLAVTRGDSTVRLGNFKKENESLFLSTAMNSESEQ